MESISDRLIKENIKNERGIRSQVRQICCATIYLLVITTAEEENQPDLQIACDEADDGGPRLATGQPGGRSGRARAL